VGGAREGEEGKVEEDANAKAAKKARKAKTDEEKG
jgi:hypothetical protein